MNEYFYTFEINNELLMYEFCEDLSNIYEFIPLKLLIETILSVASNYDNEEFIWNYLTPTVDLYPDLFTSEYLEKIEYWIDSLKTSLDRSLTLKTPYGIDSGEAIFVKWIDPTTVIMKSCLSLENSNLGNMSPIYQYP